MRNLSILILLALCALAGCGPRGVTVLPPASAEGAQGIVGQATIGPTCPVAREGEPCPDQPMQAVLALLDANGRRVVEFETDASGYFRVELPPGSYVLEPQPGPGIASASPQAVTVVEGAFTSVLVPYDSSIR